MHMIEHGKDGFEAGRVALLAAGEAAFAEEGDATGTGCHGVRIGRGGANDEALQSVLLTVHAGDRGTICASEPLGDIDKVIGRGDDRCVVSGIRLRRPKVFAGKHLQ